MNNTWISRLICTDSRKNVFQSIFFFHRFFLFCERFMRKLQALINMKYGALKYQVVLHYKIHIRRTNNRKKIISVCYKIIWSTNVQQVTFLLVYIDIHIETYVWLFDICSLTHIHKIIDTNLNCLHETQNHYWPKIPSKYSCNQIKPSGS